MIRFEQKSGDGRLPLVWEIIQGADADIDVVIDWLREYRPLLRTGLDRHGVSLRGFEAIDSAERLEAALGGVTSKLRDYVGTVPRHSIRGSRRGHEDGPADARLCATAWRLAS
jgi:hypothetical protein